MSHKNETRVIYLAFLTAIWFIYFVSIFGLSLLFVATNQAIMISSIFATLFSFVFIGIQRTMNVLNKIK